MSQVLNLFIEVWLLVFVDWDLVIGIWDLIFGILKEVPHPYCPIQVKVCAWDKIQNRCNF